MPWYHYLLRILILGVVLLAMTRIIGKRAVGTMTPIGYISGITMGTIAGSSVITDTIPLWVGVLGLVGWGVFVWLNSFLAFQSPAYQKLVEGKPTPLIENGELRRRGMRYSLISMPTLESELHTHKIMRPSQVKSARLETSGKISAIPKSKSSSQERKDEATAHPEKKPS